MQWIAIASRRMSQGFSIQGKWSTTPTPEMRKACLALTGLEPRTFIQVHAKADVFSVWLPCDYYRLRLVIVSMYMTRPRPTEYTLTQIRVRYTTGRFWNTERERWLSIRKLRTCWLSASQLLESPSTSRRRLVCSPTKTRPKLVRGRISRRSTCYNFPVGGNCLEKFCFNLHFENFSGMLPVLRDCKWAYIHHASRISQSGSGCAS